jgi:oligopeptide transport system permease protein
MSALWTRLSSDRWALGGLCFFVVVAALCLLAPWIAPPPEDLRPWLGAQPPCSSHPAVGQRNAFVPGSAEGPAPTARRLEFRLAAGSAQAYRCALRQGRLELRGPDARQLERLAIPAGAVIVGPAGDEGFAVAGELAAGGPAPAWLVDAGRPVRYLRLFAPGPEQIWEITRGADGRVEAITCDGAAVSGTVELRGELVRSFHADGREQTALHLLGTDQQGRDLWARTLHGGRLSLTVGLVATVVSLLLGTLIGALAGFRGGRTDATVVAGINVLDSVPFLFLVILLMTVAKDRSLFVFFAALGCVQWLTTARIVRAQVLSLAGAEFVLAARTAGLPPWTILYRHLIPNCLGPIVVFASLTVPAVILEESFLSFIGLGVQQDGRPLDSWGALIAQGMSALGSDGGQSWLLLVPASLMTATLLALNLVGDGLRSALDPRLARMAR